MEFLPHDARPVYRSLRAPPMLTRRVHARQRVTGGAGPLPSKQPPLAAGLAALKPLRLTRASGMAGSEPAAGGDDRPEPAALPATATTPAGACGSRLHAAAAAAVGGQLQSPAPHCALLPEGCFPVERTSFRMHFDACTAAAAALHDALSAHGVQLSQLRHSACGAWAASLAGMTGELTFRARVWLLAEGGDAAAGDSHLVELQRRSGSAVEFAALFRSVRAIMLAPRAPACAHERAAPPKPQLLVLPSVAGLPTQPLTAATLQPLVAQLQTPLCDSRQQACCALARLAAAEEDVTAFVQGDAFTALLPLLSLDAAAVRAVSAVVQKLPHACAPPAAAAAAPGLLSVAFDAEGKTAVRSCALSALTVAAQLGVCSSHATRRLLRQMVVRCPPPLAAQAAVVLAAARAA
eukprot:PLAT2963.1.p1 GENE.PLAT2963.1~~PLAT2963.1.p1  ORF type:complete len:408 (+),score=155.98 PLAT2963.1:77-1300(+)